MLFCNSKLNLFVKSDCDWASSPWYDYCDPKRYLVAVILGDIQ